MKIDFKVGDIVLCKKSFRYGLVCQLESYDCFYKDQSYIITYANYWSPTVVVYKFGYKYSFYLTEDADFKLFVNIPRFEDYFYSKKEMRKMKINKINN